MSHNMITPYFYLPYFHVSNSALFLQRSPELLSFYTGVFFTLSLEYIIHFAGKNFAQRTCANAHFYMCMRVYMRVPTLMLDICTCIKILTWACICWCRWVYFPFYLPFWFFFRIFFTTFYIIHCATISLCTPMLYICDRSIPDLD